MRIRQLIEDYQLKVLSESDVWDQEIQGGYIGDLLSFVMAHAKEGMIWITIQGHINTIAVASLVGVKVVVLAENSEATPDMLEKAKENQIMVLSSKLSSFELAYRLGAQHALGGIG